MAGFYSNSRGTDADGACMACVLSHCGQVKENDETLKNWGRSGQMGSKSFQRGAYRNQGLTIHCHTHKCAKRGDNDTCQVILDPGLWWARGICTALTTNKNWVSEVHKAVREYERRVRA